MSKQGLWKIGFVVERGGVTSGSSGGIRLACLNNFADDREVKSIGLRTWCNAAGAAHVGASWVGAYLERAGELMLRPLGPCKARDVKAALNHCILISVLTPPSTL